MELANARKMVLIDFNEYKKFMMRGEESNTSVLSRQRNEILEDKSLSDSEKILLYNKMIQRSKVLEADKRKEKYFEVDRNVDSSLEKNIIFLEETPTKKDPIENVKRKIEFSSPNSPEIVLTTTPVDGGVNDDRHENSSSLKRKKNLNRKKLIKSEKKLAFKQDGGGISSWSILN